MVKKSHTLYRGAHGVIIIVVGNGPGDPSSNPGQDYHISLYTWEIYEFIYSPFSCRQIVGQTRLFNLVMETGLGERKTLNSDLLKSA